MKIFKKLNNFKFLLLFLVILFLFYPALSNFYTHDDFFCFNIAQATTLKEFVQFFDPLHSPTGWGYYRPLFTQVLYYFIANVFNYNSVAAHLLALVMFLIVCALVYKLLLQLTENKYQSYLGIFLYAASASHFTHLYTIANQELGHAIFFLLSVILFIKYLNSRERKYITFSVLTFIAALMSKELAVTLPIILILTYFFLILQRKIKLNIKDFVRIHIPYFTVLVIYLYLHIFHYGMIQGDSYIWSISLGTLLNSLVWYGLWSVNVPKMLSDFVGPGLNLNPKLMLYWGRQIIPIALLFAAFCSITLAMIITTVRKYKREDYLLYIFAFIWFSLILSPVLFLQWHKFWDYLTLPLIGIVLVLSFLIVKTQTILKKKYLLLAKILPLIFLTIFTFQSRLTLNLAYETEWTTTGAGTARRVYDYFNNNFKLKDDEYITVVFYDTAKDTDLPWSPSEQLKVILSDNNFFEVFYGGKIKAVYSYLGDVTDKDNVIMIPARQFLGY